MTIRCPARAIAAAGLVLLAACGERSPAAPPTSRLHGRVTRGGKGSIARVRVHRFLAVDRDDPFAAFRDAGHLERFLRPAAATTPAVAEATSEEDGRYAVEGLTPGLYDLLASDESGATAVVPFVVPAGGLDTPFFVALPETHRRVEGRALRADGTPFQGWVELREGRGEWARLWIAAGFRARRTDAEGRFAFDGVGEGLLSLSLVDPGRLLYERRLVEVPADGGLVLRLPAEEHRVAGRVLADESGEDLPGAWGVAEWRTDADALHRRFEADAEGRFAVGVPEAGGRLLVWAPGRGSTRVEVAAEATGPLEVRLDRTASIRGRVIEGTTGRPAAGARVYATVPRRVPAGDPPLPTVTTADDDGRFVFDTLPPRSYRLAIGGGGWVGRWTTASYAPMLFAPDLYALEGGGIREVRVEATAAGSIRGRVHEDRGRGVGGALVVSAQGPIQGGAAWRALALFARPLAVTDARGRFTLLDLAPTERTGVGVVPPDGTWVSEDGIPVFAGRETVRNVLLPRRNSADVYVMAPEGPVIGARVGVAHRGFLDAPPFWTTDAEGLAHVGPVPPRHWKAEADAPGYVQDALPTMPGGETTAYRSDGSIRATRVDLVPLVTLRGVVHGPEGAPLDRAIVSLADGRLFRRPPFSARVQPDGRFSLAVPDDARGWVEARLTWRGAPYDAQGEALEWGARGDRVPHPDLTLRVRGAGGVIEEDTSPSPTLRLHVTDAGGAPLAEGFAAAYAFGRRNHRWDVDSTRVEEGKATLERRPTTDPVWVVVAPPRGSPLAPAVFGPLGEEESTREVVLRPGERITGRVLGPEGRGLRGLRVAATRAVAAGRVLPVAAARTDAEGRFDLGAFAPATYRLSFPLPGELFEEPPPRDVEPGVAPVVIHARMH